MPVTPVEPPLLPLPLVPVVPVLSPTQAPDWPQDSPLGQASGGLPRQLPQRPSMQNWPEPHSVSWEHEPAVPLPVTPMT